MADNLKWLIKKNNRILGPLSTSDIITGIYEGNFRHKDIVSKWVGTTTIESSEDTTANKEINATWRFLKDVPQFSLFGNVQDEYESTNEEQTNFDDTYSSRLKAKPSISKDKFVQRKAYYEVKDKNKVLKIVTNSLILGVSFTILFVVLYNRLQKIPKDQEASWLDRAIMQKQIGDYRNALVSFNNAYNDDTDNPDLALSYAELLINAGNSNQALEILNTVKLSNNQQQKIKFNLLGLIELKNQEFEGAKNWFKRALDIDNGYLVSIINLGITNYLNNNYKESFEILMQAYRSGHRNDTLLLSIYLSAVNLFFVNKNSDLLDELKTILDGQLDSKLGFRIHYQLASTHIGILSGDIDSATRSFQRLITLDLDHDPKKFLQNLDLYNEHLDWKVFYNFFESYNDKLRDSPITDAAVSALELKLNNLKQAEDNIAQAISRDTDNIEIRIFYAYMKMQLGMLSEARANLELMLDSSNYLPLVLLKARVCELSDGDCSSFYLEMLDSGVFELQSIVGLSEHYVSIKQYSEADRLAKRGIQISKAYIPLLVLNKKIQALLKNK